MDIFEIETLAKFSAAQHTKTVFFESSKIKAQVMGLEPGQQIPPCRMEQDVVFIVVEGEGRIIIDGEARPLRKSSWVFVPKEKETRSLSAETRMTVLAIQVR